MEIAGLDWAVAGNRLFAPVRHLIEGRGVVRLRNADDVNLATRRNVMDTAMEGYGLPTGDPQISHRPFGFTDVFRLKHGGSLGDIFRSVVSDGRASALERAGRGFAFVDGEFRTARFEPAIDPVTGAIDLMDLETDTCISIKRLVYETWQFWYGTSHGIHLPLSRGCDRKGGLAGLGIAGDLTGVENHFNPRPGLVRLGEDMVAALRSVVVTAKAPWADETDKADGVVRTEADDDMRIGQVERVAEAFQGFARDPRMASHFISDLSEVRALFDIDPLYGNWPYDRHMALWSSEVVGRPEAAEPSLDLDDDHVPVAVTAPGRPSPAPGF